MSDYQLIEKDSIHIDVTLEYQVPSVVGLRKTVSETEILCYVIGVGYSAGKDHADQITALLEDVLSQANKVYTKGLESDGYNRDQISITVKVDGLAEVGNTYAQHFNAAFFWARPFARDTSFHSRLTVTTGGQTKDALSVELANLDGWLHVVNTYLVAQISRARGNGNVDELKHPQGDLYDLIRSNAKQLR
jgi:hypothetical protein